MSSRAYAGLLVRPWLQADQNSKVTVCPAVESGQWLSTRSEVVQGAWSFVGALALEDQVWTVLPLRSEKPVLHAEGLVGPRLLSVPLAPGLRSYPNRWSSGVEIVWSVGLSSCSQRSVILDTPVPGTVNLAAVKT